MVKEVRFSDETLTQFHKDFRLHVERFNLHEQNEQKKFNALIDAQQANTKAINDLTRSVTHLVDDTRDIIQIHQDLQGAIKVGSTLQRFTLWLLKWGVVGTAIIAATKWVTKYFHI